jgi:hypothetical protein
MPQNDILAQLRMMVDKGAPQRPVKSHSKPPGSISAPTGLEKPMPMGDEPLAAGKSFTDMLNQHTPLGLLGDTGNPLEAIGPLAGPKRINIPSETRMGELVQKFGGQARPALPMDEASRMARANELGYVHDVYHGTTKTFSEFSDAKKYGSYGSGDFGIHVSSDPAAANFASGVRSPIENDIIADYHRGSQVLPLKAKMNKTLELPDMGIWRDPGSWAHLNDEHPDISDPTLAKQLKEAAIQLYQSGGKRGLIDANEIDEGIAQRGALWQQLLKEKLQDAGYDSIKYANFHESDGAPSYLLLDPRQLRSKFAAFDPKRANSRDLLASLAAMVGGTVASHEPE